MAHFAYYFSSGVVPSNTVIPHTWFEHIEASTFAAVNGDGGGTWAPSSVITIGGAGLTARLVGSNYVDGGSLTLSNGGALIGNVDSFVSLSGGSIFNSGSITSVNNGAFWTFKGGSTTTFEAGSIVHVDGTTSFRAGSRTFFYDSVVFAPGCNAQFDDAASFFDDVNISGGTANLSCPLNVTGPAAFSGVVTVSSDLILSGAGAIVERVAIGTAANTTFSASTTDLVFVPSGVADSFGTTVYTIDHVGAIQGKKMRFCLEFGTNIGFEAILTDNGSAVSPYILKNDSGSGCYLTMDVVYVSGAWRLAAYGKA